MNNPSFIYGAQTLRRDVGKRGLFWRAVVGSARRSSEGGERQGGRQAMNS
ncbi:hypothetical protein [Propionivibrio sp.]|nr:hypothetical protein [Propionivibrio sp.]